MLCEGGFEEFRHAIDYLLTSKYVTGRILSMDGGRHLKQVH
jgi:dihydromonapterin reductase/dihydrofolate reductase